MKAVSILTIACVASVSLLGCASDGPTPDEVQEQLRRGVSGEGQLTPGTDRADNTNVKPHIGESDVPR